MAELLHRFAWPGVSLLLGVGLQLANVQVHWLGWVFIAVAVVWAAFAAFRIHRQRANEPAQGAMPSSLRPGTLMEKHLRSASSPKTMETNSTAHSETVIPTTEGEDEKVAPGQAPVPITAASMAALERLYTEGDRMLKAASLGGAVLYGSPPTDATVGAWKQRVLTALPTQYRHRFQFGSLEPNPAEHEWGKLMGALFAESAAAQRLRQHMDELKRIMDGS